MEKKIGKIIRHGLHIIEVIVAILTLLILLLMLGIEVYRMFTTGGYFDDLNTFLHNILTIVVGLEFVRMLIDMTPANTLDVLIVAISRHVILTYDDPLSNFVCVVCIAGLFATRKFLIYRSQRSLDEEAAKDEEASSV